MSDNRTALAEVRKMVDGYSSALPRIRLPDTSRVYFVDPEHDSQARTAGQNFWLPVERTYAIFVVAYCALFSIPVFVEEALARQPDRFSKKRLPLTIRSTSSFVLDAFGYDRRTDRERDVLYSPGPVISSNHRETSTKARISDPAMAYFGVHLIREAERRADVDGDTRWHYDYVAEFFRSGGYGFPDRSEADAFVEIVDRTLAGDDHRALWRNAVEAAAVLNTNQSPLDIADGLPERSRSFFQEAIIHPQQGGRQ